MDDAFSAVPSFSTGADFLDANSQAHHKPLSAFGDLTDNARDAQATQLWINVHENLDDDMLTITLTDNGIGMSEHRLRTGIGGIAHSDKGHRAEVHYGMGAKSALPRISSSSLVFSKMEGMRSVALISTTLSRKLGSSELKVPVVSWASDRDALLGEASAAAPLTLEQRKRSLEVLIQHTYFRSERELLAQFDRIPGISGTRLVLYECSAEQYDITDPTDIRVVHDGGGEDEQPEAASVGDDVLPARLVQPQHEVSLRAYLEVLYYADEQIQPGMSVHLRDERVPPRDWTAFLYGWPHGKAPYAYAPAFLQQEEDKKVYGAEVRFGLCEPLDMVIQAFTSKERSMRNRKLQLERYTGVFYYNHDRLIMPLEKLPKQYEAQSGNRMMTTTKRLTQFGTGVVGVCREGFLTPEHNKAGYEAKTYEPSLYARSQRPSFQDLHKVTVNTKFKDFMANIMSPAYYAAKLEVTMSARGNRPERSARPGPSGVPSPRAERSRSDAAREEAEDGNPPSGGATKQASRGRKRKAPAIANQGSGSTVVVVEEGARYGLAADSSVVGTVVATERGWYALQLPDGRQTKNVRAAELVPKGFDPSQLPAGFRLAGGALDGAFANIVWEAQPGTLRPMLCTLRASTTCEGGLEAHYFDGDLETIFVGIRPSDGACVVFDEAGTELNINQDWPLEMHSIFIDTAAIARAATLLLQTLGQPPRSPPAVMAAGGAGAALVALGPEMALDRMYEMLRSVQLERYASQLVEAGWDDCDFLQRQATDEDLQAMARDVNMKPGHFAKFKAKLRPDLR